MGNFKVGKKVEIINSEYTHFSVGDIGIIAKIDNSGCPYGVRCKTDIPTLQWFREDQIKLVESKPSKKQRIETLEKEVSELKLIVHELRERKEVTLTLDGVTLAKTSTGKSVEDKQTDVIEFEGQQYRKVEREAVEGDVVIFTSIPEDESGMDVEEGKPYRAYEGKGIYKKYIKGDTGFMVHIYGGGILRGTTETVDVYEPIIQPVQHQTVPCSAVRPPIEEVGEAFFEAANKVLNPKTANQLRAEVIEKAKQYLEQRKDGFGDYNLINKKGALVSCEVEFLVNEDKRKIVALMKGAITGRIHANGIAICAEGDVYNEHIGKAIALGRALGLDVSEFEQVVQPNEVVVGMIFDSNWGPGFENETCYHVGENEIYNYPNKEGWFSKGDIKRIINDTNAIYGGVE